MAGKGNPAIFKGKKTRKYRYQGFVSKAGDAAFEKARAELADLSGRAHASDGDTFEYLAYYREHGAAKAAEMVRAAVKAAEAD